MKKLILILLFMLTFNVSARADYNLPWIIQYWYYVIEGHGKLPKHDGLLGQKTNHYNTLDGKVVSWYIPEMGVQPTMAQFHAWSDAANNWQVTTNQPNRKLFRNITPTEKARHTVLLDYLERLRTNGVNEKITDATFNDRWRQELRK